uniref:Si:ch73-379j16.2 n=1 Tax=Echeneis naucrates TaxID=173247 RepID=A0A665UM38_ECHNA
GNRSWDLCHGTGACLTELKILVENPLEMHHVVIEITDVNDHSPHFSEKIQIFEIAEQSSPGTRFELHAARDPDSGINSIRTYTLTPNDNFDIEISQSDEDKIPFLVLKKSLDREQKDKHVLFVTAVDGGKPQRSGTLNVSIIVLDSNDNRPMFNQDTYQIDIEENIPVGTTVLKVNATDPDEGSNGEIEYSLSKTLARKVYEVFELDSLSGQIKLKGTLDFEESEIYKLEVQASDKGQPPLTGRCRVIIKIKDVNDNPPEIEVTSLSSKVSEESKPGTVISLLSVTDKDSGINAKVILHVIGDVPFELKPSYKENIYSVVTKGFLDREQVPQYEITIKATDCGKPPLSTYKSLNIQISDVNDNSPHFSQNPLQFYLVENNVAGSTIFSVRATDNDLNENAAITYHIMRAMSGNDSPSSFLNINPDNGQISALKSFDFERVKTFQFHVVASDSGSPSLSSNVTVNVFILDQNDNAPVILYPLSSNGSAEGVEEIPRNVNAGHLVTKVRAYDADIGYNGWLLFSLQEVTAHSLFTLDRYTGQIRTLRSFTETDEAEHKLLILVKDNGNVSLSATTKKSERGNKKNILSLFCDILKNITYNYKEEAKKGTVVGNAAKDLGLDITSLSDRRFRVVSETDETFFEVNENNGALYVLEKIDREQLCDGSGACLMELKVIVQNPLEIHYVVVEITDINDHSPAFPEKEQTFEIAEHTLPGGRFQLHTARDPDAGTNSIRTYTLSSNDHFEIDIRQSDDDKIPFLVLKTSLDREKKSKHVLFVTAVDGGKPPRSGTLNVSIVVLDINDNRPTFSQEVYETEIRENVPVGTSVFRVNATDPDEGTNGEIEYNFGKTLKKKVYDIFELDKLTGEIRVKGLVDYEENNIYKLDIEASDKGTPPLKGGCRVMIKIKDVNDNSPEIEVTSLSNTVTEDSKPGTVISLLSVRDKDSGVNGKIIASITSNVPFQLQPSYKENIYSVIIKDFLDREKVSNYQITVKATDGGEPPLSTIKTLSIQISDVNDNSPQFSQNPLQFYLEENNAAGKSIFSVSATDNDLNENAAISYHIMRDEKVNDMKSFLNINPDNGQISALKSFDFERVKTFQFHVVASDSGILTAVDGGKPPKFGNMNILINVLDINDNVPVFTRDYSAMLDENAPVGTTVIQVNATDLDEGPNGDVVYSFSSSMSQNILNLFDINPSTGEITVTGLIDYEEEDKYEIEVEASDKGLAPLTTEKSVIIKIADMNDNAPEIEVTSFSSSIPEDSRPGTTVALISVNDLDSGLNGKVICSVGEDVPFALSPSLKERMYSLVTKSALDREKQSHYDITITAKDAGQPPLSSEKTVSVVVSDVNDNSPEFSLSPYTFYVTEANEPGASVFSVQAFDRDENENAHISYHILRNGHDDNKVTSFLSVNSETGDISALKSFDFETVKTFQFHVVASDSGSPSLSSNVTVNVFILDQNDNAPVILYPLSSNGSAEGVEEIPRNVNAGHLVTKVRAYDADIGYNGWLLFSLQEVTAHSLFTLDRYTGQIRTLRSFTETDEAEHKLLILVKDNGNVSLSATATVLVRLVEPKEAFAASDVKSSSRADEDNNVTFYLMITLASVSALFLISIIVLIAMQCSKSTDYTSKYLQETNYDGTLCHSIQYRSGDKRYMLVGPRMSIGSTIVPGSQANTLVLPDRRRTSEEVRWFHSKSELSFWGSHSNHLFPVFMMYILALGEG